MSSVPFAVTDPESEGLNYLGCEISYQSTWVNLNDGERYKISAQGTLDTTSKTWRKITAQSPVLGGNYLVHAVPEMVTETIGVWIYGGDQTNLSDNLATLEMLFEQFSFRIRWTFNEYREYWNCQLPEAQIARGQVWTHSQMAMASFQIPRYPQAVRERI